MSFKYYLRRNMPLWCVEETIDDTIRFCRENLVGDIIWKVDAEDFNSGFTPPERLDKYIDALRLASARLNEAGIGFSINPWLTMNHASRGRYTSSPAPDGFHWRVDSNGNEMTDMVCPLSQPWRKWLLDAYRKFATLKPKLLWIEDDFKTFVHDSAHLGCFCEHHLKRFAQGMTLEELLQKISNDPAMRKKWFYDNAEVLLDICRDIEKTVHEISTDTRLGQMCSWSSDSFWWKDSISILAGGNRPLARTSLSSYMECTPMDMLPDCGDILKESAALPPDTENLPELENFPYTVYSKSAATTRQQIVQAALDGCTGITMNLFDMSGSSTGEEPRYGKMLKSLKPRLDAIASSPDNSGQCIQRGVSIPFKCNYVETLPAGNDNFRFDGDFWMTVLASSGISSGINLQDAKVQAMTGRAMSMFSDDEITEMLHGSMLLDSATASELLSRGFGAYIGITDEKSHEHTSLGIGAERYEGEYLPIRYMRDDYQEAILRELTPMPKAQVLSTIVNWRHEELFPGWMLFENSYGGRCAIYTLEMTTRIHCNFMNWKRRRQMQKIVSWLCHNEVPLIVDGGAWMTPWRRDWPDCTELAVMNYDHDAWDYLRLRFSTPWKHPVFRLLDNEGNWQEINPDTLQADGKTADAIFSLQTAAFADVVIRVSPN